MVCITDIQLRLLLLITIMTSSTIFVSGHVIEVRTNNHVQNPPPRRPMMKMKMTMSDTTTSTNTVSSNRRSFLLHSTMTASAFVGSFGMLTGPANAKYGDSTNIELPSYIDFLIEKNYVPDPDKALYKGTDPTVILKRLQDANNRLSEIPILAEQKKWSQIQGILTGPLGTLSQTINQIVPSTGDVSPKLKDASKKLKSDLISIGQAAAQKQGDVCTVKAKQTSQDLEALLKLAFE